MCIIYPRVDKRKAPRRSEKWRPPKAEWKKMEESPSALSNRLLFLLRGNTGKGDEEARGDFSCLPEKGEKRREKEGGSRRDYFLYIFH